MVAAAAADRGDASSDSSDSSDDDAFELSEQDMAAMHSLEEAVKVESYAYDNHVQVKTLPAHAQLLCPPTLPSVCCCLASWSELNDSGSLLCHYSTSRCCKRAS